MAALRQAASKQLFRQRRTLFTSASSSASSPLRTGLYATVFTLSAGLFAVYYFDARSALHRYLLTPVLRYSFDAETGHQIAVKVLRSGLGPKDPVKDDDRLKLTVRSTTPLRAINEHKIALGKNYIQSNRTSCRI